MSKQVAEDLTGAFWMVRNGWCQEHPALDKNGRDACPFYPHAVCWCASGAIEGSVNLGRPDPPRGLKTGIRRCRAALRRAIGGLNIEEWNDAPERTQAEVLAAFSRAVAAEETAP